MLVRLIANLIVLRAAPQDLPATPLLLGAAIAAHFGMDVLTLLDQYPVNTALYGAAADTLLLVALTHTVLMLRNLANRTMQTLTALASIGAAFSAMAWGVTAIVGQWIPAPYIWAAILLWYLFVVAHIARHALSISLPAGAAVAFAYFILSVLITGSIVGEPPPDLASGISS